MLPEASGRPTFHGQSQRILGPSKNEHLHRNIFNSNASLCIGWLRASEQLLGARLGAIARRAEREQPGLVSGVIFKSP